MIKELLQSLDVFKTAIPFCMLMIIFISVVYIATALYCGLRKDKKLHKEIKEVLHEERMKAMIANILNYAKTNSEGKGAKNQNTCEEPKLFIDGLYQDICKN